MGRAVNNKRKEGIAGSVVSFSFLEGRGGGKSLGLIMQITSPSFGGGRQEWRGLCDSYLFGTDQNIPRLIG